MRDFDHPDDAERREPSTFQSWLEGPATSSCSPWIHLGVDSGSLRLATCNAIKRAETMGKSKLIDTFAQKGIPLGAHRAFDPLHDPLYGPIKAVRDLGVERTFKVWCPHMASDVMTRMSLPLPGTYKAGVDSLRYQLYAKGLVNVRTVIAAPVLNVALADFLVRADLFGRLEGDPRTRDERTRALLETHAWNAVVAGALAGFGLMGGPLAPASVVAYASTAAWSALSAGAYFAVLHRAEIEAAVRSAATKVASTGAAVVSTGRKLLERPAALPETISPQHGPEPARIVPRESKVGPIKLGLAAALLTIALATGGP